MANSQRQTGKNSVLDEGIITVGALDEMELGIKRGVARSLGKNHLGQPFPQTRNSVAENRTHRYVYLDQSTDYCRVAKM